MGTDMLSLVEKRQDGVWQVARCPENSRTRQTIVGSDYEWYNYRNYFVYGLLSGVRSKSDHWNKPVEPLQRERGCPADASTEARAWCDEKKEYATALGYVTLCELDTIDWYNSFWIIKGYVDADGYAKWKSAPNVEPDRLMKEPFGQLEVVSNEQMEQLTRAPHAVPANVVTKVEWRVSYHELCKEFVDETMYELRRLAHPDDVRIIFCFV